MADIQPIARRGDRPATTLKKPPPNGSQQRHPAEIFADMAADGAIIGTLVAVVDRAKNLPNLKSIGKQDPYCVLRLGKNAQKTEPDKRGGQTPKWDAELRFPVREGADYRNLKVVIFTDDKKTELIGETNINLDHILDRAGGGQSDGWHPCKCKGKHAGDIRVELTFWDERPRETAPLLVNTRQVTGFEKEDFKRPDKSLAGPRKPGSVPKPRELPEKPKPKSAKENVPPESPDEEEEEEEEEEPASTNRRRDRERHRDREPRERNRGEERRHGRREHHREKSRHQPREAERHSPEYDRDPYREHAGMQYDQRHDPYGRYQAQPEYNEQNQIMTHARRSPNPAAYPGYQQDFHEQQQQWQQQMDHSMNSMALTSQNAPPPLPHHRHVEFTDNRRSMALPPPQSNHALQHRKSRSELYTNDGPDMYQLGQPYSNQMQLVSNSIAPMPPRHGHGYEQQYQDQQLYGNSGFEPQHTIQSQMMAQQQQSLLQQQQQQQQSAPYQSTSGYQGNFQDQYTETPYQSQLARPSDLGPPPLPQHGQSGSYRASPNPHDEFHGALSLTRNTGPAPPPPAHRNAQPRMSMPAVVPMAPAQQAPLPVQQSVPISQPKDMYEQSFQLESLRGVAPPPLPSHGGPQYQNSGAQVATQLQPPIQEQASQLRPRGNSEPPPYAITDGTSQYASPPEPQQPLDYAQQVENPYSLQQQSNFEPPPLSRTPGYTSITDYSQAGVTLQQRLSNLHMSQNPEHAFDPTTALVLAGGQPPPRPHGGAMPMQSTSPAPPATRGRPSVAPISTNIKKPLSRSPSPHPLALTPGYGPDSPGDGNNGSRSPAPFSQHQLPFSDQRQPPVDPVSQSNYHAPYVNDVTGRRSMDSSRFSLQGNSPLMQPIAQPLDANRRRSVSPMPPLNSYSQELVSSRGAPPPPPSHRMSQQLVYKHDPTERPGDRSNRNSAYDYPAQAQQLQNINQNHSIPDSTYQSASTSYTASQNVDDFSREYMNHPAAQSSHYDSRTNQHMRAASPQVAPMNKPRATSPMPGRGRTPEPDQPFVNKPVERRMTLGATPFSPDDYDIINPVNSGYNNESRSPSGNVSTSPLARSPGAISPSPGQYMTPKEEKKLRREEEKAARKARKKYYTPNSANRDLNEDDILPSETWGEEPRRNSFDDRALGQGGEEVQPLTFRPRRQTASPQPPGADIYGTSPGGRGYGNGPKSVASNSSSNPSTGYGYGGQPVPSSGGKRPLPGAPVMRNAIMGPEDYYNQQQNYGGAPPPARAMQIPQPNPANMTQEQWSLSQELSSINIGGSSRRRTGTWA